MINYNLYEVDYFGDEKRKECEGIVKISNYIKEQCKTVGLPFYETSYQRQKVFDEIMTELTR